ncbi:2',3'-cyclic-nucleotide 3'-phosphodiesterase-like [Ylistrum balloti]|uniref:2',3'-cyclic-nucleotide 3'-phosphodiesterase-like n=1 Tax=Ylistrum balloti TaxID=509963 RepID=UPI002905A985|nr:2',3'-cyclic-nucleotide 3'-phosphodiesterase-like [Ylistrum balloti]
MGNCCGKRKDYKHVKTDENEVADLENLEQSQSATTSQRLEFVIEEERSEDTLHVEPPALLKTEHVPDPEDTTDFAFFRDQKTINHIQKCQTMFIMRGPPGSGKSSLVRKIESLYKSTVVCSADNYFMSEDGQYKFNASQLPYAHKDCQDKAKAACSRGNKVVVIDNTNTKRWEMKAYVEMAKANHYVVIIVEPRTKWRYDAEELARRNSHGVKAEDIRKKLQGYQESDPYYFGWFLTVSDSVHLKNIAKECVIESVKIYPEIRDKMFPNIESLSDLTEEMVYQYFSLESIETPCLLHCTAKFIGNPKKPVPRRAEYLQREDVKAACGKVFELTITGITVTPRTIGARVVLTTAQCKLFDKPEEEERDKFLARSSSANRVNSLGPETISNTLERGRSAHITITAADGVKNVQTTFDLLDICDLEWKNLRTVKNIESTQTKYGSMRHIGEDFCEVDLSTPIRVCTLFSGFY